MSKYELVLIFTIIFYWCSLCFLSISLSFNWRCFIGFVITIRMRYFIAFMFFAVRVWYITWNNATFFIVKPWRTFRRKKYMFIDLYSLSVLKYITCIHNRNNTLELISHIWRQVLVVQITWVNVSHWWYIEIIVKSISTVTLRHVINFFLVVIFNQSYKTRIINFSNILQSFWLWM